jgi:hypothetical protein
MKGQTDAVREMQEADKGAASEWRILRFNSLARSFVVPSLFVCASTNMDESAEWTLSWVKAGAF